MRLYAASTPDKPLEDREQLNNISGGHVAVQEADTVPDATIATVGAPSGVLAEKPRGQPPVVQKKPTEAEKAAECRRNRNALIDPAALGATVTNCYRPGGHPEDIEDLALALDDSARLVASGDLRSMVRTAAVQAINLNHIFVRLAEQAADELDLARKEVKLRLALRAQAQYRSTLETVALILNPKPAASFIKQASIVGQQQVNQTVHNGPAAVAQATPLTAISARARAQEN